MRKIKCEQNYANHIRPVKKNYCKHSKAANFLQNLTTYGSLNSKAKPRIRSNIQFFSRMKVKKWQ